MESWADEGGSGVSPPATLGFLVCFVKQFFWFYRTCGRLRRYMNLKRKAVDFCFLCCGETLRWGWRRTKRKDSFCYCLVLRLDFFFRHCHAFGNKINLLHDNNLFFYFNLFINLCIIITTLRVIL